MTIQNSALLDHTEVPERAALEGLENRWGEAWAKAGTYTFDRDTNREGVYSIDTPPPTVSGSLHIGHVFSYTHTDVMARYKRMRGMNVFYPMGWDDNGLPTERRVQNYYGVRCDPSLPYDPDFVPPHDGGDGKSIKYADQQPISRRNFIELCWKLTAEDEKQFEHLWRYLGLSVDWDQNYQTIGAKAQKVAQYAFLKNIERGEVYQAEAPGLWDVTFQTAVAQAELEAREYPGFYHAVAFHGENGNDVIIETTRPELLPACVALIAHPDDERYQDLFGTYVTSPLFNVKVPVLAHPMAEIDKGAGIAMCCTFGDVTDVQWWRDLQLPLRNVLRKDGRLVAELPEWITDPAGIETYNEMAGKTTFSARKVLVEKLKATGEMIGDERPTQRMTNFFEKGDKPLEIVMSRQWYIRNGGTSFVQANGKELQSNLIQRGREIDFHPDFMRVRYENWVQGLNNDWLVSRQRFFGVPLPVWYKVSDSGDVLYDDVLLPHKEQLPIDPTTDCPPGYDESQRGAPGGFIGETDILDTWATSSLTPQIAGGWLTDDDLFSKVYPMDVRPQGQDIIRTWLFSTAVRAHLEFDAIPWKHAAISGWILDPDHKKMSKSKGNVVTPMALLEKHGSDAVRYWAASARLGTDAAFDEQQMKIGRRLAMKVLNASRFALQMGGTDAPVDLDASAVITPIDQAMLAELRDVVQQATLAFEKYDHTRALELTETCFWTFCDDYLEIVKDRAYDRDGVYADSGRGDLVRSARVALNIAIDVFVRLLAPVLPYATEEVWSWYRTGSVHQAPWPQVSELEQAVNDSDSSVLNAASSALAALRRVKTEAKVAQRAAYEHVSILVPRESIAWVEELSEDLRATAHIDGDFTITGGDVEEVVVTEFALKPVEPRKK
ncbi:MAG: valine--tRNA ligase [Actinomycetaceae bacterium]|nr:valine--tRNA ligase [Arcanobacterium sp.]MDD7505795.1 valine--tRNA ligase [Actinomycetaceae bacterium]MDY6142894.1 valine--tRNA ligase [Arcanobacterium sp.]